jgi:hypothetical protein
MQQTLATLYQFKRHLGIPPDDTTQDDRLLAALRAAAAHLEREAHRQFTPQVAAIRHVPLTAHADEIALRGDLLTLTGVTDANGPVPLDEITVEPASGVGTLLRRTTGAFAWGPDGVRVTGVWGWHDNPDKMWVLANDGLVGTMFETDPNVLVGDADALMSDNQTPRFAVGALLRVGGTEYLTVLAVDPETNWLTVARGVNGTDSVRHEIGELLEIYRPPYDVLMSVLALAAWLYRQPDAPTVTAVPADVLRAVLHLRRLTVA